MKWACALVLVAAAVVAQAGCAGGRPFSEVEPLMKTVAAGSGRVYFYRDGSPFGSGVQPDIKVDGEKVGKSRPGGFFFIDRAAGECMVTTTTEEKYRLVLHVDPGRTYYVRTKVSMGVWVGLVHPLLEDEATALRTLKSCKYIGYDETLGGRERETPRGGGGGTAGETVYGDG